MLLLEEQEEQEEKEGEGHVMPSTVPVISYSSGTARFSSAEPFKTQARLLLGLGFVQLFFFFDFKPLVMVIFKGFLKI